MYNGVAHFPDFRGKNVPKIRGLKLEGFFTSIFYRRYKFSKFANSFQNDQVKRLYK